MYFIFVSACIIQNLSILGLFVCLFVFFVVVVVVFFNVYCWSSRSLKCQIKTFMKTSKIMYVMVSLLLSLICVDFRSWVTSAGMYICIPVHWRKISQPFLPMKYSFEQNYLCKKFNILINFEFVSLTYVAAIFLGNLEFLLSRIEVANTWFTQFSWCESITSRMDVHNS